MWRKLNFLGCLQIKISVKGQLVVDSVVETLMNTWEDTSYHLELRQTNPECAEQEYKGLQNRSCPKYKLSFDPDKRLSDLSDARRKDL